MKPLESHPVFNPAIKVVDVPQKEKKTLPVSENKGDANFNLFEQTEKPPPAAKGLHLAREHQPSRAVVNIKHAVVQLVIQAQYAVNYHSFRCCMDININMGF